MDNPDFQNYVEWKDWDSVRFGSFSRAEAAYYRAELLRAELPEGQPLDILEIGFGNGSFLGWARSRGHRVVGVEVIEEIRTRARMAGIVCFEECERIPAGQKFDAIVAFDVFEHVTKPDLVVLVQKLADRLKAGGRIIARFPNGGSPFGLHYQNGDLTHVTSLALGSVNHLAALTGMKVLHCGAPQLPLKGVGLFRAVRRSVLVAARCSLEFVIRHIYFDGNQVCTAPNLVAVLSRGPLPPSGTVLE